MYFKTLSTQLQQFASKFTFLFRVSVRYEHTAKMHIAMQHIFRLPVERETSDSITL